MGLQDMKCFLAFIISLWIPVRIEDSLSSLQGSNQSKRRGQEIASLNIQRVSFINGPDECFTTCNFWKSLVYLEWILTYLCMYECPQVILLCGWIRKKHYQPDNCWISKCLQCNFTLHFHSWLWNNQHYCTMVKISLALIDVGLNICQG